MCRRGSLVWLQAVGKGVEVLQQQAHHKHVLLSRCEGLLGRGVVSGWARATAPTAAPQETSIRPGRTSHAAGAELTAAQSTEARGLTPHLGNIWPCTLRQLQPVLGFRALPPAEPDGEHRVSH